MNKNLFIGEIASKASITKKDAGTVLDAIIEVITEQLSNGEQIKIAGFGTFEVRDRAARTCNNPQTGEKIEVAAKKVPVFKASSALKAEVNS